MLEHTASTSPLLYLSTWRLHYPVTEQYSTDNCEQLPVQLCYGAPVALLPVALALQPSIPPRANASLTRVSRTPRLVIVDELEADENVPSTLVRRDVQQPPM
jgi:hypothetical protein